MDMPYPYELIEYNGKSTLTFKKHVVVQDVIDWLGDARYSWCYDKGHVVFTVYGKCDVLGVKE